MQKIINIRYIGLEFGFGYYEDDEESHPNKNNINAEVILEIENDGDVSDITHKMELHDDVSFSDFMTEEDKQSFINETDNLGEFIQILRQLIILKIANDLGIEIADIDYVAPVSLRVKVDELDTRATATEDALLALMMMGGGM